MDRPVLDLTWDYPVKGRLEEPDAEAVLAEINGWDSKGEPLTSYTQLKDDGSTTCGCWIYSGVYASGVNQAARRVPGGQQNWIANQWGWAWPANRRVLYNRASADPDGRPWSERKALVWWDAENNRWTGHDVPDFVADRPPDYAPPDGATGVAAITGTDPFIMQGDGKAWLFAPALVHDLGRPERFANMLRVFKPSSPMSVGSWLLTAYGPLAGAAAVSDVTGILPAAGALATAGAGLLGPGIATYTAALLCDTAVPGWHEGHREMPYLFAGSASCAAAGLGLLTLSPAAAGPARTLATLGAPAELVAKRLLLRRLGEIAEPYETGRPGRLLRAAELLTVGGLAGAVLGRRNRAVSALAGASLLAASALTRFGVFEAGLVTARDPKYTIVPQRRRRDRRGMN